MPFVSFVYVSNLSFLASLSAAIQCIIPVLAFQVSSSLFLAPAIPAIRPKSPRSANAISLTDFSNSTPNSPRTGMPPKRTLSALSGRSSSNDTSTTKRTPFRPPGLARKPSAAPQPAAQPVSIPSSPSIAAFNDEEDDDDDEFGTVLSLDGLDIDTLAAPATTTSNTARAAPAPAPARPSTSRAAPPRSPTPDVDVEEDDPLSPARANVPDLVGGVADAAAAAAAIPGVPPALLARIMHECFSSPYTQISRPAHEMMGRYVDVFVREAVARAAAAQREKASAKEGGGGGGGGGGGLGEGDVWLDAAELEEVAPGLVMDF
ncbi:hypothetical protein K461DRAFT_297975 [Myriangium duriaei CBS 260.36]|uniref:Uncharacterized protein n=1 Tax=Myriangium duriaei CBS 260.36 TaxID=1168546 RepID=A0A9P4MI74_9PEZI|nr:hypothetical protein K461DRAFT_297975 [Myriangium duriaei CBS 260.36]